MTQKALFTGVTGQDCACLAGFLLGKGHETDSTKCGTSLFNIDRQPSYARLHPATQRSGMMGARVEPAAYWINVGGKQVAGRLEIRLEQLKLGIASKAPSGVLIRDLTIGKGAKESYATHAEFVEALTSSVSPDRLTQVFGIYSGSFHE